MVKFRPPLSKGGLAEMGDIDYAALAKQAAKAVEGLSEPALGIAYSKILDELIAAEKARHSARQGTPKPAPRRFVDDSASKDPVELFLTSSFDASLYVDLFLQRGMLVTKCLAVLKLAKEEFGIDGLSPGELEQILTKKFRAAGVHSAHISRDLGRALKFVSRLTRNGKGVYLLTAQGEGALKQTLADISSP